MKNLLLGLFLCLTPMSASFSVSETPADPLESPQWVFMHKEVLNSEPVVFDPRVEVSTPEIAEDSLNVPVSFNARKLPDIVEIVVMSDLNPITRVLRFFPGKLDPSMSFRMKLQQASPIRVAAKTKDGIWHLGGVWVDAAGGGCTLPSVGTSSGDWTSTLGQVSARLWEKEGGSNRLRLKIMHPMDTGLASGIPVFHIEELEFKDVADGSVIARLELHEPISENPMLSLDVGKHIEFYLDGRDNNGNIIQANLGKK